MTYQIRDLLKVHFDLAVVEIWKLGRIMYQSGDLALPHFARTKTEDKQQRVDHI